MSNFSAFGGLSKETFLSYHNSELTFLKDNIFLRNIKLKNMEILKMVSFLVRDKNWIALTYSVTLVVPVRVARDLA